VTTAASAAGLKKVKVGRPRGELPQQDQPLVIKPGRSEGEVLGPFQEVEDLEADGGLWSEEAYRGPAGHRPRAATQQMQDALLACPSEVADLLAHGRLADAFTQCALSPEAGPAQFVALLHATGATLGGASAVPSDSSIVAAFIAAASRCGAFPAATAAFEAALTGGERSIQVFNAHIAACGRAGQPGASDAAFAVMKAELVRPSQVTYNALISAHAAASDLASARRVFAAMLVAGEVPNQRTYGALLAAAAGARDAKAAIGFYQSAAAEGVTPNQHMVSSLLTALARDCGSADSSKTRAESLALAWESVTQLQAAHCPANAQIWSALATVCGRAGAPDSALEVLRRAGPRERHNPFVMCSCLTACRGSPPHARLALAALDQAPKECRTTVVLNAALALRASTLGDLAGCEALLHAMASGALGAHARADAVSYATVMTAAAQGGDQGVAMRAFQHMTQTGRVAPTPRVLAALVSAIGRGGTDRSLADAQLVVDGMAAQYGVPPNAYVYNSLLDAHVKAGDTAGAFAALARMRACGLTPTTVTFGILVDGCRRASDVAAALGVARDMHASGVTPSDTCANLLVVACSKAGMLDDMLAEVRALARRGGDVQRGTLNAVLVALCRFQYGERAIAVRRLMAAKGVVPSSTAFSALAEAVAKEGLAVTAYETAADAATHGITLSPEACSAVVCALCRAGELDQALWVAARGGGDGAPSQQLHSPHRRDVSHLVDASHLLPIALLTLTAACARVRRVETALQLLSQLLRATQAAGGQLDGEGDTQDGASPPRNSVGSQLAAASLNVRQRTQLYDTLIEACSLTGRLEDALFAYDAATCDPEVPTLRITTLASLEAACKRSQQHAHRVWDVCATVKAQRQRKQAAPRKRLQTKAS
jgi:pentatricopeptide repeat protein